MGRRKRVMGRMQRVMGRRKRVMGREEESDGEEEESDGEEEESDGEEEESVMGRRKRGVGGGIEVRRGTGIYHSHPLPTLWFAPNLTSPPPGLHMPCQNKTTWHAIWCRGKTFILPHPLLQIWR